MRLPSASTRFSLLAQWAKNALSPSSPSSSYHLCSSVLSIVTEKVKVSVLSIVTGEITASVSVSSVKLTEPGIKFTLPFKELTIPVKVAAALVGDCGSTVTVSSVSSAVIRSSSSSRSISRLPQLSPALSMVMVTPSRASRISVLSSVPFTAIFKIPSFLASVDGTVKATGWTAVLSNAK